MRLRLIASLVPVLTFAACGNPVQPLGTFDAGLGDDLAGAGGGTDDLGGGGPKDLATAIVDMTGFNTAGSPVVTITAPASGAEISGDKLTVTATVTSPTNTLIASETVAITITPPGGGIVSATMTRGTAANTYTGSINIAQVPSGMATFTVSAADITGKVGSAQASYVHDHGPTITFVKPTAATAKGTLSVEIIVDDPLHPITMLSQVQAGIRTANDVTLTQVSGATPFRVVANVDLNAYSPTLDGPQVITCTATNSNNTKQTAQKQFTVDNAGPTIIIKSPAAGSFVGGVTQVQADIQDLSGVNPATVIAVFGGNLATAITLTKPDPMGTVYTGFFDVRSLGKSYVYADVSVRADDTLGNHGELGEQVIVDNTPPWMSMDGSIQMRVAKLDALQKIECSQLFSPLGPAVSDHPAHDGQVVQQIVTLRTRIEDRGNSAPGLIAGQFSGLDPTSVTMFALPATTGAVLAVDTDNDGICDDVNPTLIPTTDVTMSGEALALAMSPLAQGTGTPDYRAAASPPPACDEIGDPNTTLPPPALCITTGMSYTLQWNDKIAPIWSIGPISTNQCVGYQVDTLNHLPEGPTCVITRAVDNAGNQMVSYPLHICIDRGGGKCSGFTYSATDCTGKWDKVQQKLVAGTCTMGTPNSDTFPLSGEVRYLWQLAH